MLSAILVDDEPSALKNLKWEIEKFCPEVKVIDSFSNPEDAISGIDYLKPDCVFLDIEMPEMDGFQLLKELRFKDFCLIITTAYDNYAIKAFKENAIDYLLKPIDSDDLQRAVSKIIKQRDKNELGFELENVITSLSNNSKNKIGLPLAGRTLFLDKDEIIFCKSDGNYTEVFMVGSNTEILSKNLKEVHNEILSDIFFRVHNSYCVNINHIKEYIRSDGHYLLMSNSAQIPISRSKRDALVQRITL